MGEGERTTGTVIPAERSESRDLVQLREVPDKRPDKSGRFPE
jgi:hypothetical protein